MKKRLTLLGCLLLAAAGFITNAAAQTERRPNVVIIFADDLGYGDLGVYGHPTIKTPHLDRMAADGMKLTQFYSAAPVCTPSRAGLLTGRLPVRNGMCSLKRRVLFPDSAGGLPQSEITIASALKKKGYATGAVGKWHLGHLPQFLPTSHGFDSYFGIPYSNDMDRVLNKEQGESNPDFRKRLFWDPKAEYWNVPLMENEKIVEQPADQNTITRRYTEHAVDFIKSHKEKPFFLYLAHSMPHVPLFASEKFKGKSLRGLYGDVIEEIDWSVGQVLSTLRDEGLAEDTVVFFTSDNGPWLIFDDHGGSAGLLRDGKGSTWEGGMREPALAWWPGTIKAGSVSTDIACTMDLFTTSLNLAGAIMPKDRIIDGVDLSPVLKGSGPAQRDRYFYYRGDQLYAARLGSFKAHFITQDAYGGGGPKTHEVPELYDLGVDPGEQWNVAADHPEVIAKIREAVAEHEKKVVRVPSQLEIRLQKPQALFDGKTLKGWKDPDFAGGGEVHVKNGQMIIEMGESLSGRTYDGEVPASNYELSLEAMKIDGNDFFCGITFPVKDTHCTFILGGWGGAVVGISSINHMDASDNETTDFMKFDKNRWYDIRVRVTDTRIETWLDNEKMVDLELENRRISMRPGDIELNMPLGIANYQTVSAIRNFTLTKISTP